MPKAIEKKIKARGGAARWRRKSLNGEYLNIAVVRKPGKRGGKTIAYKKKKK